MQMQTQIAGGAHNVLAAGMNVEFLLSEYDTTHLNPEVRFAPSLGHIAKLPRVKEGMQLPELPAPGLTTRYIKPAVAKVGGVAEKGAGYVLRGVDRTIALAHDTFNGLPKVKVIDFEKEKVKAQRAARKAGRLAVKQAAAEKKLADRQAAAEKKAAEKEARAKAQADAKDEGFGGKIRSIFRSKKKDEQEVKAELVEAAADAAVLAPEAPVLLSPLAQVVGVTAERQPPASVSLPAPSVSLVGAPAMVLEVAQALEPVVANEDELQLESATTTMAEAMNEQFLEHFNAKFDLVQQSIAFKPDWLGENGELDKMAQDEELLPLMHVGFQVKCVDIFGRRVIATGTAAGMVIVYHAHPNTGSLHVITPAAFQRSGFLRVSGYELDATEVERVVGSLDGKSVVNIGKNYAMLTAQNGRSSSRRDTHAPRHS